jgi:hypothetical protein
MSVQAFIAGLLMLLASEAAGSADIPSGAANCSLQSPPPSSGEVMGEEKELDLKVFPRRKDFPSQYTGCQTSWVRVGNGWRRFSTAYLERGKLVALVRHGFESGGKADLVCRYNGKKLDSSSDQECPNPSGAVLPSMPAGCLDRIRSAGNQAPAECKDD